MYYDIFSNHKNPIFPFHLKDNLNFYKNNKHKIYDIFAYYNKTHVLPNEFPINLSSHNSKVNRY